MTDKRQIINIINFIRASEPRIEINLLEAVQEQVKLLKAYSLKGTFLLQYDALTDTAYTDLLKDIDENQAEIGIWLEVVKPLAEKAGIVWHGGTVWNPAPNVGFTVAYSIEERKKIADVIMEDFKSIFGYYPRSMGSWAFDAYTLEYLTEKYGLDAACNCKEQWGTDGYTLWGGYYGQGYYPCKSNILCPAQNSENQINTPVFRMLGSDPIYQYDFGLDLDKGASSFQMVITLEPVYIENGGGGNTQWVDWYLKENFSGECLSFGYAQVGQENSFGWSQMKDGLTYQFKRIAEMKKKGLLDVETLGDTGRWYKHNYKKTPPSTIVAHNDWKHKNRGSVWYNCNNYRLNIYSEDNVFWIRDMYLFNEEYQERYFDSLCENHSLQFDNLPVMDGNRWSGHGTRAGIYPMLEQNGELVNLTIVDWKYFEADGNAIIKFNGTECGTITFVLSAKGFTVTAEKNSESLIWTPMVDKESELFNVTAGMEENKIYMNYNGFDYGVTIQGGYVTEDFLIHMTNEELKILCIQ